jgi:hypothetical protein
MNGGGGEGGNREVSPFLLLSARGVPRRARAEACLKEGGSWERYASWYDTSEPKVSDVQAGTICFVCSISDRRSNGLPMKP